MRIRYLLSATAAAALLGSPAPAQETAAPGPPAEAAPPSDAAAMASLTAEQRASFDAWPVDVQAYFRALSPERQTLFFRISDESKVALAGFPPEQQVQAWAQIEAQAAAMAAPAPTPDSAAATESATDESR